MVNQAVYVYPGPEVSNPHRVHRARWIAAAGDLPLYTSEGMKKWIPEANFLPNARSSLEDTFNFRELVLKEKRIGNALLVTSYYHAPRIRMIAEKMLNGYGWRVMESNDQIDFGDKFFQQLWGKPAYTLDYLAFKLDPSVANDPRHFQDKKMLLRKPFEMLTRMKAANPPKKRNGGI